MIVNILVGLIVAAVALSEETATLRGPNVAVHENHIFGNQESNIRKQERNLNQMMSKLSEVSPALEAEINAKKMKLKEKSTLDYPGGHPKLSYDGFVVSRQYTNKDCSGEGEIQLPSYACSLFCMCLDFFFF